MKTVHIIALAIVISLLMPLAVSAQESSGNMYACENDSDCTIIYACQDVAINANSTSEYVGKECDAASPHNPSATAICSNGSCTLAIPGQ